MNEAQPSLDEKFKDNRRPVAPGVRLRHVADRLRRAELLDGVSRQADAQPHVDAGHHPRQPRFPGKHSGVIVDYANVFASLAKALAIYGAGKDGNGSANTPVKDKQQLVEELRQSVVDATAFCAAHSVMLGEIEATATGSMERLSHIQDGMNALISPEATAPRLLCPSAAGEHALRCREA
jgi:type I restriction enzyme R subunit